MGYGEITTRVQSKPMWLLIDRQIRCMWMKVDKYSLFPAGNVSMFTYRLCYCFLWETVLHN
uniref:Uncharacterized protein n=1 Tax=Oryza glumipatula TaxID=40148 RepID=A0A0E0A9T0_9ORYZ